MFITWVEKSIDRIFSLKPQRKPNALALEEVKLVAHRGATSHIIKENTFPAFALALEKKCWAIEFDIRWTEDNIPVVHHDPSCSRIFARPDIFIEKITAEDLRREIPNIPFLSEIIHQFAQKLHFMIEIKTKLTTVQNKILFDHLSALTAGEDFHILGLAEELLTSVTAVANKYKVAVAELNTKKMSELAIKEGYAGLAGHYLLITNSIKSKHKQHGQKIGVGFVNSKNSFYREVNRGCDWLFSDSFPR